MRQFINLLLEEFNTGQFLERLRGVMELIRRGAYTGERDAAKHAFDRLIARAKIEVARMREPNSGVTHIQIEHFTRSLERLLEPHTEPPKAKPKPNTPPIPRFRVDQWVVHLDDNSVGKVTTRWIHDNKFEYNVNFDGKVEQVFEQHLRAATQDEVDAVTAKRAKTTNAGSHDSGFNITLMARYVNSTENSNKVYGVMQRLSNGKIYTFWGGYHKALKVKYYALEDDAIHQFRLKVRKGYRMLINNEIDQQRDWVTNALRAEFARLGESRKISFMPSIRNLIDLVEAPFGRRGVNQQEIEQARKYPSAEAYANDMNPISVTNTDPPRIRDRWQDEQDKLIRKWNYWHDVGLLENDDQHHKAQKNERNSMDHG